MDRGSTAAAAVTSARRCGPKLSLLSVAKAEIITIERESLELVRLLDVLSKTLFPIDNFFFSERNMESQCPGSCYLIQGPLKKCPSIRSVSGGDVFEAQLR